MKYRIPLDECASATMAMLFCLSINHVSAAENFDRFGRNEMLLNITLEYQQPFKSIPYAGLAVWAVNQVDAIRAYVDGKDIGPVYFDKTVSHIVKNSSGSFQIMKPGPFWFFGQGYQSASDTIYLPNDRNEITIYCRLGWLNPDKLVCSFS